MLQPKLDVRFNGLQLISGDAYLASYDQTTYIAIKLNEPSSSFLARDKQIEREITSKNIRKFDQLITLRGEDYYFYQNIKGEVLGELFKKKNKQLMKQDLIIKMVMDLCFILKEFHQYRMLGRCFNVFNIILAHPSTLVMMEFGFHPQFKPKSEFKPPTLEQDSSKGLEVYDLSADMWLLGVLIWSLLHMKKHERMNSLMMGQNVIASYDPELLLTVEKMIELNPKDRMTFAELYQNKFFAQSYLASYYKSNEARINHEIREYQINHDSTQSNLFKTGSLDEPHLNHQKAEQPPEKKNQSQNLEAVLERQFSEQTSESDLNGSLKQVNSQFDLNSQHSSDRFATVMPQDVPPPPRDTQETNEQNILQTNPQTNSQTIPQTDLQTPNGSRQSEQINSAIEEKSHIEIGNPFSNVDDHLQEEKQIASDLRGICQLGEQLNSDDFEMGQGRSTTQQQQASTVQVFSQQQVNVLVEQAMFKLKLFFYLSENTRSICLSNETQDLIQTVENYYITLLYQLKSFFFLKSDFQDYQTQFNFIELRDYIDTNLPKDDQANHPEVLKFLATQALEGIVSFLKRLSVGNHVILHYLALICLMFNRRDEVNLYKLVEPIKCQPTFEGILEKLKSMEQREVVELILILSKQV